MTSRPYSGQGKYVFISYSHKDTEEVMEIISMLQKRGYNLWFDEGIDAGIEWGNDIAEHIIGCSLFIAYITENYLASHNCCDEINFARDHAGDKLLIFGEEIKLPLWMEMRFSRLQAVMRYKYSDSDSFVHKIETAQGIAECRGGYDSSRVKPEKDNSVSITELPKEQCRERVGRILDDMLRVLNAIAEVLAETVEECISREVYPRNIREIYKQASKESVKKILHCGTTQAFDYYFFENDFDFFTDLQWEQTMNVFVSHNRDPEEELLTIYTSKVSKDIVEQSIIDEIVVRRGILFKLLSSIRKSTGFIPELLCLNFKLNNNVYSWIEIYEYLEKIVQ